MSTEKPSRADYHREHQARAEAEAWLREAMFVARAEQREQLLRNIAATGAKIKLLLED